MGKIPKREGQGINGLGVSIMALVMLLLMLPLATVAMMELASRMGDELPSYHQYDNGTTNPTGQTINSMGVNNDFYSSKWLNSGNTGNCEETGDRGHFSGSQTSYSSSLDFCQYPNQPSTVEYASETWGNMWVCSDIFTTTLSECGDDDYSIAISDWSMDYTDRTITAFKYQALGLQLTVPCDSNSISGIVGNYSFDYSVSIQIWYLTKSGLSNPLYNYRVADYSPDVWSGVSENNNRIENTAANQCLIGLEINHQLDYLERKEYADMDIEQYESMYEGFPIVMFIIDIENFYDMDLKVPLTLSNLAIPFEDYSQGSTSYFLHRFEFDSQSTFAITSSSKIVSVGIGSIFWVCAVASTPVWTPLGNKIKEVRK